MDQTYQIDSRTGSGGLHLQVKGEFNRRAATILANLISKRLGQGGRVFVNTEGITQIANIAPETFKDCLAGLESQPEKLFFIGSNGHDLAPEGYRVLVRKQPRCSCHNKCCGRNCRSTKAHGHHIMN